MAYIIINHNLCSPIFADDQVKQLDYDSPDLLILRKWMNLERENDTPIDSEYWLYLNMDNFKDVKLLKDLTPFALPPFYYIEIKNLSKAAEEVKNFLFNSLGQQRTLALNYDSDLVDGSEWVEAIIDALSRVKVKACLWNFNLSKENVEAIIDNSLHLEELWIRTSKLRKKCCLACDE
jgi:hypothetical protein